MNSWSSSLGGSVKTATRFEMPLCTRSAASSAPAGQNGPISDDVGRHNRFVYDKRPSCGWKNWLPKGANSNDRECG